MTDKIPQESNVKNGVLNMMNLLQISQYSWNILFFSKSIWVLLELIRSRTQNFTIIDQEKHKIKRIYIWNIDLHHQYMEFLSLRRRRSSWQNIPRVEEQGKRAVFTS